MSNSLNPSPERFHTETLSKNYSFLSLHIREGFPLPNSKMRKAPPQVRFTFKFLLQQLLVLWEIHITYFDHIHTSPTSSLIHSPSLLTQLCILFFLTLQDKFILPTYSWMLGLPLECGLLLTLPLQTLTTANSSTAVSGVVCLTPLSMLKFGLVWPCSGLHMLPQQLWIHTFSCPVVLRRKCLHHLQVLHSFCAISHNDPRALGQLISHQLGQDMQDR